LGWYEDKVDPDCGVDTCPLHPHYLAMLEHDPINVSRKKHARAETAGNGNGD
jgi:hypothetical protein